VAPEVELLTAIPASFVDEFTTPVIAVRAGQNCLGICERCLSRCARWFLRSAGAFATSRPAERSSGIYSRIPHRTGTWHANWANT
jgi:hypothetical protein